MTQSSQVLKSFSAKIAFPGSQSLLRYIDMSFLSDLQVAELREDEKNITGVDRYSKMNQKLCQWTLEASEQYQLCFKKSNPTWQPSRPYWETSSARSELDYLIGLTALVSLSEPGPRKLNQVIEIQQSFRQFNPITWALLSLYIFMQVENRALLTRPDRIVFQKILHQFIDYNPASPQRKNALCLLLCPNSLWKEDNFDFIKEDAAQLIPLMAQSAAPNSVLLLNLLCARQLCQVPFVISHINNSVEIIAGKHGFLTLVSKYSVPSELGGFKEDLFAVMDSRFEFQRLQAEAFLNLMAMSSPEIKQQLEQYLIENIKRYIGPDKTVVGCFKPEILYSIVSRLNKSEVSSARGSVYFKLLLSLESHAVSNPTSALRTIRMNVFSLALFEHKYLLNKSNADLSNLFDDLLRLSEECESCRQDNHEHLMPGFIINMIDNFKAYFKLINSALVDDVVTYKKINNAQLLFRYFFTPVIKAYGCELIITQKIKSDHPELLPLIGSVLNGKIYESQSNPNDVDIAVRVAGAQALAEMHPRDEDYFIENISQMLAAPGALRSLIDDSAFVGFCTESSVTKIAYRSMALFDKQHVDDPRKLVIIRGLFQHEKLGVLPVRKVSNEFVCASMLVFCDNYNPEKFDGAELESLSRLISQSKFQNKITDLVQEMDALKLCLNSNGAKYGLLYTSQLARLGQLNSKFKFIHFASKKLSNPSSSVSKIRLELYYRAEFYSLYINKITQEFSQKPTQVSATEDVKIFEVAKIIPEIRLSIINYLLTDFTACSRSPLHKLYLDSGFSDGQHDFKWWLTQAFQFGGVIEGTKNKLIQALNLFSARDLSGLFQGVDQSDLPMAAQDLLKIHGISVITSTNSTTSSDSSLRTASKEVVASGANIITRYEGSAFNHGSAVDDSPLPSRPHYLALLIQIASSK